MTESMIEAVRAAISSCIGQGTMALNEDRAKAIFRLAGLPVVDEIACQTKEEVLSAGKTMGFPAVLKGIAEGELHKSDKGLVITDIRDASALEQAAHSIEERAGKGLEGFLVQPMVRGRRELVAGMFRDPQFGPVIMFGLGGVLTEALGDVVFRVAPLSEQDAEDMLASLRSEKLLGAFRGEAPADRACLRQVLLGLSDLATAFPEIREMDINPLIVSSEGAAVAVDGLIVLDPTVQEPSRTEGVSARQLGACFYPRSVAFVGASGVPGKWGHMLPANTFARDFDGEVFLVNPKGGTIMGRKVYKDLASIPGEIDLAVVTIPAERVEALIPELAEKQVKGMLLISSGFREVGEAGRKLEDAVMARARAAGIIVLGPNTMGICNPHAGFFCAAANAFPLPGSTALVCQSGNLGTQLLAFAERQDIGIRAFSGSGNEAMVTIEDYMDVFETDELTRTVVLYLESVKDGRRFLDAAARVSLKKPVVVLKGGRTRMGERAAASHTGAMASDAGVFDAACDQAGIIRVGQPMELLDLSAVFSSQPMPAGNRVAIMTLGGGWGVVTTDLCAENGLEVPGLSDDIIVRLNGILPSYWSHGNPVDIVGENDPSIPKTSLEALLQWDGCDAVIHLGIHGKRLLAEAMIDNVVAADPSVDPAEADGFKQALNAFEDDYIKFVAEMADKYGKPVLGVSLLTDAKSRALYRFEGISSGAVFFPTPERAVRALAGMVRYQAWKSVRTS